MSQSSTPNISLINSVHKCWSPDYLHILITCTHALPAGVYLLSSDRLIPTSSPPTFFNASLLAMLLLFRPFLVMPLLFRPPSSIHFLLSTMFTNTHRILAPRVVRVYLLSTDCLLLFLLSFSLLSPLPPLPPLSSPLVFSQPRSQTHTDHMHSWQLLHWRPVRVHLLSSECLLPSSSPSSPPLPPLPPCLLTTSQTAHTDHLHSW